MSCATTEPNPFSPGDASSSAEGPPSTGSRRGAPSSSANERVPDPPASASDARALAPRVLPEPHPVPDPRPLDHLVASMYDTLRKLAKKKLPGAGLRHSVDPTELLHECYLKLAEFDGAGRLSRPEFLAMAGKVIRHVVVDRAREVQAQKRGGRWKRITLHESSASTGVSDVDLLELDEALTKLAVLDERQAKVVELRFFSGLTNEEAAGVMGVSVRTVVNEWTMARAWLRRELSRGR